jgi:hypothetical protein
VVIQCYLIKIIQANFENSSVSRLNNAKHTYRLTLVYESEAPISEDDILSKIQNENDDISNVMVKNEQQIQGIYRVIIIYESYKGPVDLKKILPNIAEGRKLVQPEIQQEVQNEDGTFSNVNVTVCDADGCNARVSQAVSIDDENGTLAKRYLFCNNHMQMVQNGQRFKLKEGR